MNECRSHPLCEDCPYHSCKDMDLFEAEMAEIFHNDKLALELAVKGHENWPDEEEFIIGLNILKKKVN